MNNLLSSENLRLIVAVISLMFAIWQYLKKRRIKKLIILEAIELHKNISVALGATDAAIIAFNAEQNPVAQIGRAQGICQAILSESAKLYCNLKDTTIDDIDDLITNKHLAEQYKNLYYSFSNPKRGFIGKIIKEIKSIF